MEVKILRRTLQQTENNVFLAFRHTHSKLLDFLVMSKKALIDTHAYYAVQLGFLLQKYILCSATFSL